MTKIDIFSGFLGAGKTTLIRKLIAEGYKNEKLVLIENEFGEIAIDGGFLKDAGVQITEMNSGRICRTLVGDFNEGAQEGHGGVRTGSYHHRAVRRRQAQRRGACRGAGRGCTSAQRSLSSMRASAACTCATSASSSTIR